MAVIWGLDLKEMQWGKFKSGYMWNTEYHNRRTKFIIYQLAMILCVVSESLGTAALSDYVDQQKFVANLNSNVTVHNNNFIGIASFNIFVGIYVATIFGSAFFFDLFWPERKESQGVKMAWKICSVFACMLTLACALSYTYIVASQRAYVTGTNAANAQRLLALYGGSPLKYSSNGRAIASVVFLWPGMIFTFVSTYLLWHSLAHIDAHGPMSKHARSEKPVEQGAGVPTTRDVA
ncbi:gpi ethanolamine phosphate transferase 2 [Pyrenophora seminiperda CCB06]|uniref:Gpi ethanolamine phosphate transferase 2 n=1 Tax=Pyrenophora seminiperda CCB06 TaxID=1302712 RepID=A0A3M7M5V5_9PLEO|nr:gpi ethanolamine phosphate transferase 2 [Pyrenophora seminiperda CCB06]